MNHYEYSTCVFVTSIWTLRIERGNLTNPTYSCDFYIALILPRSRTGTR